MKKQIFYSIVAMILVSSATAQDVRFTQQYANPLRLNPALMGPNYEMKFNLGYRSQWSSVGTGYNTGQFTFIMPVLMQDNGHKLDVGLNVMSDEAGAFTTFDGALSVGYTLKINSAGHFLSAAIMGGYVQNSLDANNLTFDEQYQDGNYDGSNSNGENLLTDQKNYADVDMGLLWYFNPSRDSISDLINAFAGVSAYHLNSPNNSFTEGSGTLPARITGIIGITIFTSGALDFSPQTRYDRQEGSRELSMGLYTGYQISSDFKTTLGLWYRDSNSFAIILRVGWKQFNLGYSYDMPGSELNSGISNASVNEISLSYGLDWGGKKGVSYQSMGF